MHQALAATLLGAKTQWPLLVRIEQQCTVVCRDRIEDLMFRGECLEEDRKLTLAEYLQQLDNPEPFGTSFTLHTIAFAFAFNVCIKLYIEKSNGTVHIAKLLGMTG